MRLLSPLLICVKKDLILVMRLVMIQMVALFSVHIYPRGCTEGLPLDLRDSPNKFKWRSEMLEDLAKTVRSTFIEI